MEPTDEARRWISELIGAAVDDHLSRAPQAWASLGPALAAIHEVAMPAETEPAVQVQVPMTKIPMTKSQLPMREACWRATE